MDAFESIVAGLLEREGFWIRSSYRVTLTKEEKAALGKTTLPRVEIDMLAYRAVSNELRLVECKSFLDSDGVRMCAFDGTNPKFANRFKLFVNVGLYESVSRRVVEQLTSVGACRPNPKVTLCLVAGRIPSESERVRLAAHFNDKGWLLLGAKWLKDGLLAVSEDGYVNDVGAIVAKLLMRK